jgi:Domain of unknown function (DUF4440)
MPGCLVIACLLLAIPAWPQQPASSSKVDDKTPASAADTTVKDMFEGKIKAEWEAIKNKDKKAYGDFLADDYEGVELDGQGERTKTQALNELADSNVANYTLWGYKLIPLGADAAFAVYEVTIQFPPRSVVRFSRLYIGELWVKRDGQWKVLHYQETHVK